nr:ribonuclease H-like domain-containing protein [Tanacetum cinerariifolium]
LHSQESDNRVIENQEKDRYKTGKGYHDVPPPYIRNLLPLKPDLVFTDDTNASESVANVVNVELSKHKTSKDKSMTHRPDAPIIEDWIPDSEDETKIESVPKQRKPSFVKSTKHVKTFRESVKKVENNNQAENFRTNNQKSRAVLTRSRLVSLNAARLVPTTVTQSTLKCTRPVKNVFHKAHSPADEGFLVGYSSVNCKAFRVFNSRTRIVQETLQINFLENKPNVAGIGPKWLFDIDTLTMSMMYQIVVAGNQPNNNACIKENLVVGKLRKKTVSAQQYVLLPLCDKTDKKKHNEKAKRDDKGKSPVDLIIRVWDSRAKFEEFSFNITNRINVVSEPVNAARPNPTNSTNYFNTASPSDNVVNDEEDVGAETDLSNLETNIHISPIPTIRVHKDHLVNQIIGNLNSAPQTRSMTRMVKEQGRLHQLNDEDFHTCMFACFLSQEEPKKGHTQEEDIDYDEVFAPVVRIEAIRMFLAYASFMGFM